jgi:hypothetical protein
MVHFLIGVEATTASTEALVAAAPIADGSPLAAATAVTPSRRPAIASEAAADDVATSHPSS